MVGHLATLGPFALIFPVYSVLLDHLPPGWFSADWVRYLFAGLAALCCGLALRVTLQKLTAGQPTPIAALPIPAPRSPERATSPVDSAHTVFEGARRKLLTDFRLAERPEGRLSGWSQFFSDEVPPSAIGTSYGLRIALTIDLHHPSLDRHEIVATLLALQRPGGGWAARSQRGTARPEVTAWVLAALARAGLEMGTRNKLVARLEALLSPQDDPVGMKSTIVITSAICTLAEVQPSSAKLPELVTLLMKGVGVRDQSDGTAAWGRSLGPGGTPSVPHTARAVVALIKAARATVGADATLIEMAEAGIEWISKNLDLELIDEQLRRPEGDATDVIYIGHFTPAWVARALMTSPPEKLRHASLRKAVGAVLERQDSGVWNWPRHQYEPTWMTYQGLLVLRDYSVRNLPWPP